uniref:hypothetical protein n=1 Tax=Enterococcus faecium TaxID=1352 RepID=UPI003DA1B20D
MSKQFTIKQPSLMKGSYLFLENEKQVGQLDQSGIFRQRVSGDMDGKRWRFVKKTGFKETKIS